MALKQEMIGMLHIPGFDLLLASKDPGANLSWKSYENKVSAKE